MGVEKRRSDTAILRPPAGMGRPKRWEVYFLPSERLAPSKRSLLASWLQVGLAALPRSRERGDSQSEAPNLLWADRMGSAAMQPTRRVSPQVRPTTTGDLVPPPPRDP